MEEALENGKESSHSAHTNGMNVLDIVQRLKLKIPQHLGKGSFSIFRWKGAE
jgi:hypothetical protein